MKPDLAVAETIRAGICLRSSKRTLPDGTFMRKSCGAKSPDVCPVCALSYRRETMRLIGSGCNARPEDGITVEMLEPYRFYFLTLTAPSFGKTIRSGPDRGAPRSLDKYEYRKHTEWHSRVPKLFTSTGRYMCRQLPGAEYFGVAEWQRRLAIHYHSIVRVPEYLDPDETMRVLLVDVPRHKLDGLGWGRQVDVQQVERSMDDQVAYMSKIVSYSAKSRDARRVGRLADHSSRLARAARRIECSRPRCEPASCDGLLHGRYGFGGHPTRYSKGWSLVGMTRSSLSEERKRWVESRSGDLSKLEEVKYRLAYLPMRLPEYRSTIDRLLD